MKALLLLPLLCAPLLVTSGTSVPGKASLKRVAALQGEWAVLDARGEPTDLRARYELIAADTVVMETLLADTEEETVTLYHLEEEHVSVTQLSARGGPARLRESFTRDEEGLVFEATEGGREAGTLSALQLTFLEPERLRISWSMRPERGDPLTRRFELERQDSVGQLARRLSDLRADLESLQREVDGRLKRSVSTSRDGKPVATLLETRTIPGSPGWNHTGVPFRRLLHADTVPFASTYATAGDSGLSAAHYPFVAGAGCRVSFSVLGGHAYIALVRETKAPPRKIQDIPEFSDQLREGKYGTVLERVVGGRWTEHPAAVEWDLSKFAGEDLRLYVVDAESNTWGQIAISEVRITEEVER